MWRVSGEAVTRRSSIHHATLARREVLRYQGELSTLRTKYCDDFDTKSGRLAAVCRGEFVLIEHPTVSALRVRGDAPARRASSLAVVIQ